MFKIAFLLLPYLGFAQTNNVLFIGNYRQIEKDPYTITSDSLPMDISSYDLICVFSSANSCLTEINVSHLNQYVEMGGALYLGAESWPLQSEFNQITRYLFQKECYGIEYDSLAQAEQHGTNLYFAELNSIPSGKSTVSFPLHPNLKIEAWVNDNPLIQSGFIGKGRLVIDGGYSRFYSNHINDESREMWVKIKNFLLN